MKIPAGSDLGNIGKYGLSPCLVRLNITLNITAWITSSPNTPSSRHPREQPLGQWSPGLARHVHGIPRATHLEYAEFPASKREIQHQNAGLMSVNQLNLVFTRKMNLNPLPMKRHCVMFSDLEWDNQCINDHQCTKSGYCPIVRADGPCRFPFNSSAWKEFPSKTTSASGEASLASAKENIYGYDYGYKW